MKNKERVVIVDDSKLMLYALNEILSPFYIVHSFQDARAALSSIKEIMPSCIVLDIVMPDGSGFDVLEKIKADPDVAEIPVIMMTSQDASSNSEERSFELGAVDFIPKPFKAPVALARVRTHVNLYEYHKELELTSITDGLTGIFNRRGFDTMLEREINRSVRDGKPLSLLMADIDHFKLYNDYYGHQAGDNALHWVGQTIKKTVRRSTDVTARYGGEEFAVILPGSDSAGAEMVANSILTAVSAKQIKHERSPVAPFVTISVGSVTVTGVTTSEKLIRAADTMLYKAKDAGRNRTFHTTLE